MTSGLHWKAGYSARLPARLSPEEVLLAEDAPVLGEALLGQQALAVRALETLGVPRLVEHLEDELVEDGVAAFRALGQGTTCE